MPEWNCWYHIMNCGFPLKVSRRDRLPVHQRQPRRPGPRLRAARQDGQGRFRRLVQRHRQGPLVRLRRLRPRPGVHGERTCRPGFGDVKLDAAGHGEGDGEGRVRARTCRSAPRTAARCRTATRGRSNWSSTARSWRRKDVPADDKAHDVSFDVPIDKSSWVALRHFPQMHTNPVNVIVGGKPIRASRESAKWCIGMIEQLWKVRGPGHHGRRTRRGREDVPEGARDLQEDRGGECGGELRRELATDEHR